MGMPLTPASICTPCGQPDDTHLTVCPTLDQPAPAETPAEQEQQQHDLGQAI